MDYKKMKKADFIAYIEKLQSQASLTLQVTACQVFPFREGANLGHIKAIAAIVLGDAFQIRGLRIVDSENGLFVSYPVDPFYKGDEFRSVCGPITRDLREHIESVVLEHYQQSINTEATHG